MRSFAFVVARALVTEIKKLQQGSSNGQLQPDEILSFFSGSQIEVCYPELHIYQMNFVVLITFIQRLNNYYLWKWVNYDNAGKNQNGC